MAGLAFCGFCMIYMLRVNLSVAIVAMTANRTHTNDDGTIAIVSLFEYKLTITQTLHLLFYSIRISLGKDKHKV